MAQRAKMCHLTFCSFVLQTVGDKVIPAGHTIVASPAVSMMLPEAFSNPERYDPDRFAPGREEQKAHPFAFIGFGGGRHGCTWPNKEKCEMTGRRRGAEFTCGGGRCGWHGMATDGDICPGMVANDLVLVCGIAGMGANFGLLQVKTIVSTLIRDFELTPVTPFPKPDYTAMVVGPKGPVTVRFQRRQKK